MKLTKKQREKVVELLRCAADMPREEHGMIVAAEALGIPLAPVSRVEQAAWDARNHVLAEMGSHWMFGERYRDALLEAAMRVEEGSWPCS